MPTHAEIAALVGCDRSYITKCLNGDRPMPANVRRTIDELRRREVAENYAALADDALAAGETEVAAGALRMAASKLSGR
jgi:hypothetical protein